VVASRAELDRESREGHTAKTAKDPRQQPEIERSQQPLPRDLNIFDRQTRITPPTQHLGQTEILLVHIVLSLYLTDELRTLMAVVVVDGAIVGGGRRSDDDLCCRCCRVFAFFARGVARR
jgi:hypothetical protein